MDRGGGCIRNATDDAVVVIQRDAFASLDLKTSRACVSKDNSKQGRSVLVLDKNADPSFGGNSSSKGCNSGSADRSFRMRKATDKGRCE